MGWDFSLSASKLSILKDCPLCFWLHMNKLERPRGIFPSLPGGMDRIIKDYMDLYRGNMPPELKDKVPGSLWGSQDQINKLRNWKSGLKPVLQTPHGSVSIIGAFDDLVTHDGKMASLDGKTKGSAVKNGDTEKYYQVNADTYSLMLRESGFTPSELSYFLYVWPKRVVGRDGLHGPLSMEFEFQVVSIKTDAEQAYKMICHATELLRGTAPTPNPECEYCSFSNKRKVA